MVKPTLKTFLILAAASWISVAFAGQKYLQYNYTLSLSDGNNNIFASIYCIENPDGSGGTHRSLEFQISGNLGGNDIQEYEFYSDPGLCPKDENIFGGNSKQSVTISFRGYVVTANCSDQITAHGSSTEFVKFPGQNSSKKYLSHFKKHRTDNPYNMSCVGTVTQSGSLPEVFIESVYVDADYSSRIQKD